MSNSVKRSVVRFCPTDGSLLARNKYCEKCQKCKSFCLIALPEIMIQNQAPRKPRNFYEKMPEGIEDNHVDEMFLKGLVHKSNFDFEITCESRQLS